MLTKLTIRNFKRFEEVEIELGNPVVFVGPNDSGKTTALQSLAVWDIGVKRWLEKRGGRETPEHRPGVTINRRDLLSVPVPTANLLWRDRHVRDVSRKTDRQETKNIRVDIALDGVTSGRSWQCGLEFDYANEESIYCRPMRIAGSSDGDRIPVPEEAGRIRIAFLQPMSGLAAVEPRYDLGRINVLIGEGQTAQVLRNLCHQVLNMNDGGERWSRIKDQIERLFGVRLEEPVYIAERGEITMGYHTRGDVKLDLSSSGRGLQQTLLLLSYIALNENSVLLLDEPDAHLEVLRQRQIYQLLSETAAEQDSQIIIASHSEVVLNEAADRDVVVAFVGRPHRIDDRGSQVLKSLKEIGWDQFYLAEQRGWVLYVEGSTDLEILRALAKLLNHPAQQALETPFLHAIGNQPSKARDHFRGLREAKRDLIGFVLTDHDAPEPQKTSELSEHRWQRRETENYICRREVLLKWAEEEATRQGEGGLFIFPWVSTMESCITEVESALQTLGKPSPWSGELKVTDDFLDPLFVKFFDRMKLPNLMNKTNYHQLARHLSPDAVDPEVVLVLNEIARVAQAARPIRDE